MHVLETLVRELKEEAGLANACLGRGSESVRRCALAEKNQKNFFRMLRFGHPETKSWRGLGCSTRRCTTVHVRCVALVPVRGLSARVPWPTKTGPKEVSRETDGWASPRKAAGRDIRGAGTRRASRRVHRRAARGRTRVTDDDVLEQVRVAHLA